MKTRKIPLSKGYFATVDANDYNRVMQAGPWYASVQKDKQGNVRYVRAQRGAYTKGVKRTDSMSRFILNITDPKVLVDHKDRDSLRNTKKNLRIASRSQNNRNRKRHKGGHSKYRGVTASENGNFTMMVSGFKTEEQAAKAYDLVSKTFFGDFGFLNFPKGE